MKKHYSFSTALNLASRGLNFLLFSVIVSYFGASRETDWFFFIFGISNILNSVVFSSLEAVLVPGWHSLSDAKQKEFIRFAQQSGILLAAVLLSFGLCFAALVPQHFGFHPPDSPVFLITVALLVFAQPALVFFTSLFASHLQSRGHYSIGITNISLRSLGAFAVLFLFPHDTMISLAAAYFTGELLRAIVVSVFARRKWKFRAAASSSAWSVRKWIQGYNEFKPLIHRIFLMMLSILAISLAPFVDYLMAGHFESGSATLVEYAATLKSVPAILLNGILVYLFGRWSAQSETLDWKSLNKQLIQIVLCGVAIVIPMAASVELWGPFLFKPSKFSPEQFQHAKELIFWFMISSIFYLGIVTLQRIYFTKKKFKIIFASGILTATLNAALNVVFIKFWGLKGIAISTTCVEACVALTLWWNLSKGRV